MTDLTEMRRLGHSGPLLTTIGFGGGPSGWLTGHTADETASVAIETAWLAGIRYFDTSPYYGYGRSERRLGGGLCSKRRADFVLSSKVGRLIKPDIENGNSSEQVVYDYSRDGAIRSIEASLSRLGLDRIDIVLIHDIDTWTHGAQQPVQFAAALDGAYRAIADLKAQGNIAAIGLGVNEWQVCQEFAKRVPIDCCLLAGRLTLLEQRAAETFLPFCESEGIGLIIGGPFNSGILATGSIAGAQFNYAPAPQEILARVRYIEAICRRHGVELAAAALAYPLRFPAVTSVIPGMANAAEVLMMQTYCSTTFPAEFWNEIAANSREDP